VVEEIKWSRPFFLHRGVILWQCLRLQIPLFFGFWGAETQDPETRTTCSRMAAWDRSGALPSVNELHRTSNCSATSAKPLSSSRAARARPGSPRNAVSSKLQSRARRAAEFTAALKKSKLAANAYAAVSVQAASREYLEWIVSAKRQETRDSASPRQLSGSAKQAAQLEIPGMLSLKLR